MSVKNLYRDDVDINVEQEEKILDESTRLLLVEPAAEIQELQSLVAQFWSDDHPNDIIKEIGDHLRNIEGSIVSKYQNIGLNKRERYELGELKELMDASEELTSNKIWMWRYPALFITVMIASFCIPLGAALEHVITEHPILGGFPPAISAAAGCIGIQNTAIIVRALGVKLIKGSPLITFFRYAAISFLLSFGAAITEAIVAWIVVSAFNAHHSEAHPPWSISLFYTDVPVVIFIAMLFTGTLAGIMGAGIPLLITWVSGIIKKSLDPAHWVGPIETIAQELSAAVLTFYIAEKMFRLLPES